MSILRVPVNSSDHVQGPDNAPVTLLEYGDYECPHCGRMHPVVQRVQRYFGLESPIGLPAFPTDGDPRTCRSSSGDRRVCRVLRPLLGSA